MYMCLWGRLHCTHSPVDAHLLITWWILIYEYLTPLSTHFLSIKRLMLTVSSSDDVTPGIYLTLILYTASRILQITINTLRPRQNCRHFADDILKCIFLNENVWISIKVSLKCVPKGPINNNPALVQIMAWHQPGDKSLSEPIMVNLLAHVCVTRPQWVNSN